MLFVISKSGAVFACRPSMPAGLRFFWRCRNSLTRRLLRSAICASADNSTGSGS